jgi:drug/metabolite transporter (DMT)-like permease
MIARRDLALLVAVGAIWGASFPVISLALNGNGAHFSPLFLAAFRCDVAIPVVFLLSALRRRRRETAGASGLPVFPKRASHWRGVFAAGALNVSAYQALLLVGQPHTNATIAAIIVGLNPILTTGFSHFLLPSESLSRLEAAGVAIGLGGIIVLAFSRGPVVLDAEGVGEALILLAIVSFALGSTLVRRSRHGMEPFAFAGWQNVLGALILHAASLAYEGGGFARWTPASLAVLAYLGFVASGLGFALYFTLLDRIGATRANLVSHVSPVSAAAIVFIAMKVGHPIPGSPVRWPALIAFALIVAGFALIIRARNVTPKHTPVLATTSTS